jgi:hypothetical protein
VGEAGLLIRITGALHMYHGEFHMKRSSTIIPVVTGSNSRAFEIEVGLPARLRLAMRATGRM